MTWTPGPWTVSQAYADPQHLQGWDVHASPERGVLRTMSFGVSEADARLIAAAPEMADFIADLCSQFGSDPDEYRGRLYVGHLHGDDLVKGIALLARIHGKAEVTM